FRAQLYRVSPEAHVLMVAMHHIVSDDWSLSILFRDLGELYRAASAGETASLPSLPVQYSDFARWQRGWLCGEALQAQLDYWRAHLTGAPQVLELPTDRPRPSLESFRGATHTFTLPADIVARLRAL